ncbi:hypothetical protein T05_13305, partial [Trichinella murrelli]
MPKVSSQPPPKKLDVGKKRLVRLLGELNQLLEEEAAVPLIEEQLRMLEEHYRQIEELQAKARALITERQARDEKIPGVLDQLEVSVHEQADLSNATNLAYLGRCLTGAALDAIRGSSAANQGFFRNLGGCSEPSAICDECHRGFRIQWDKLTLEDSSLDLPAFLRFLQEQVQLSDAVRKTNYLRLEEKRSMSAVEKPRNSGQGSEAQKTVAFVVCRFCQKQHALSECSSLRHASRQKQRE